MEKILASTSQLPASPLPLNILSERALDGLALLGTHYEKLLDRVQNPHWESEKLALQLVELQQKAKGNEGLTLKNSFRSGVDSFTGIGNVLVVFSKEHASGNRQYSKTLESAIKTTGQLGLSSALGVAGAALASSLLGVGLLPSAIGLGIAAASYSLAGQAIRRWS